MLRLLLILKTGDHWIGPLLIVLGLLSALFGISVSLYQKDIKRVFAYSSVENIGIITLGIGLGVAARAAGHRAGVRARHRDRAAR